MRFSVPFYSIFYISFFSLTSPFSPFTQFLNVLPAGLWPFVGCSENSCLFSYTGRYFSFVNFQPSSPLTMLPFVSLRASCFLIESLTLAVNCGELPPSTPSFFYPKNIPPLQHSSYALSIIHYIPFPYVNWMPQILLICMLPWYYSFSVPGFLDSVNFICGCAGVTSEKYVEFCYYIYCDRLLLTIKAFPHSLYIYQYRRLCGWTGHCMILTLHTLSTHCIIAYSL